MKKMAICLAALLYMAANAQNFWDEFRAKSIDVEGVRIDAADNDALYSDIRPEERDCIIHLIPYYTWNNRGINEMRVWIPEV